MTRALEQANIYRDEQNPRGEISRALLSHDAALRRIMDKCRDESVSPSCVVGYVLEVASAALGETT